MTNKTTITDDKIDALLDRVNQERQAIQTMEEAIKRNWETNCSYQALAMGNGSASISIQTANEAVLITVMSDLLLRQQYDAEARKLLELEVEEPKIQGYTIQQWTQDIKKRLAKIKIDGRKKILASAEEKLSGLLSPERRRALELAAIEKELGL